MKHNWSNLKNDWLIKNRNLSFEEVEAVFLTVGPIGIITGHSGRHKGQSAYLIILHDYVHIVPFIDEGKTRILCTIIPSRKYNKLYQQLKKNEKDNKRRERLS